MFAELFATFLFLNVSLKKKKQFGEKSSSCSPSSLGFWVGLFLTCPQIRTNVLLQGSPASVLVQDHQDLRSSLSSSSTERKEAESSSLSARDKCSSRLMQESGGRTNSSGRLGNNTLRRRSFLFFPSIQRKMPETEQAGAAAAAAPPPGPDSEEPRGCSGFLFDASCLKIFLLLCIKKEKSAKAFLHKVCLLNSTHCEQKM